jgi:RNA polymerase sigma factor (sigma-70 family)
MSVDIRAWYTAHGPMVLRRCRALLRDEEESVEAMQDVFVEVVRRQATLVVDSPVSFLYRTATNVCLNRIRSRKRRPQDADTDVVERIACAPEAEERTIVGALLDRIFAREQTSTREMAVMHLVDGMTLEEVAAETGLSVSGIRKRLRVLKAHVQELQLEEGA